MGPPLTFAFPRLQQIIEQQSRLTHVTLFSGYDIYFFFLSSKYPLFSLCSPIPK